MKITKLLLAMIFTTNLILGQVIIDDFLVNDSDQNLKGLGRTSIAVHTDGSFAIAWQDYNDYNHPIAEQPRVAVQLYDNTTSKVGPLNLFQGETRPLFTWTSDFLDIGSDLAFTSNGILVVAVEHEGDFSLIGDQVSSSEVGWGAINQSGLQPQTG